MRFSPIALFSGRIEDYCPAREAATLKGVSVPAVYEAVKQGKLTAYEVLGQTVLLRAEVEKWRVRRKSTAHRPGGECAGSAVFARGPEQG